jgi:MFS family permease
MDERRLKTAAIRFVVLFGIVSLFADFTYEGSRSITGQYLAVLGANATAVGVIAGFGELVGYALRLFTGRLSERTKKFWSINILGYAVQMAAVPLLALADTWQIAAGLIVLERIGKAIRSPSGKVMLSHAARHMDYGWGFGLHEAMDQAGALLGPLLLAGVLSYRGDYRLAFAILLIPALLTIGFLLLARIFFPRPEDLDAHSPPLEAQGLPRAFWIYLAGAGLVAAGFADFSLMAFHFEKADTVPDAWIPVYYAIAMATSGAGSLIFGRWFDRAGIGLLAPLTIVTALSAPLVFLGGFWLSLVGAGLWGIGMGVHESIIPAAVATMVPSARRGSAYGLFTAGYGVSWFLGSAALGFLYDLSMPALIIFSIAVQFLAVPFFLAVRGKIAPP